MNKPVHPSTLTGQILMFLGRTDGKWATWGQSFYMPTVQGVFPVGTTEVVQLRFMQGLQRKGLVGGCDCGCRGDYVLTHAGLEFLANTSLQGECEAKEYLKEGHPFGY